MNNSTRYVAGVVRIIDTHGKIWDIIKASNHTLTLQRGMGIAGVRHSVVNIDADTGLIRWHTWSESKQS